MYGGGGVEGRAEWQAIIFLDDKLHVINEFGVWL